MTGLRSPIDHRSMLIDSFVSTEKSCAESRFSILIRMEVLAVLILLRCHLCSHGQFFTFSYVWNFYFLLYLSDSLCSVFTFIWDCSRSHGEQAWRSHCGFGMAYECFAKFPEPVNTWRFEPCGVLFGSDISPSGTLTSSMTGNETLTPSAMYTSDPHPAAPFPEPEHPHPAPHRQGRYTERVVHQIHFKIFTHSNGSYSLKRYRPRVISRTRDPEHFFYGLSGQWEWSKQTADYWRCHFGPPLPHSNNPFQNNFMENASPSGDQVPSPTIASLATQLSESLLAATASGELGNSGEWSNAWASLMRSKFCSSHHARLLSTPAEIM